MKRVLHIVSSWGVGGVERYIYNFSKQIKDYEFDILTLREASKKTIFDLGKEAKFFHLPSFGGSFMHRNSERQKAIVKIINDNNYELVHIDSTTADSMFIAKAIKKNTKAKVVYTSHASDVEKPYYILKKILHYYARTMCSKYIDAYVAVSSMSGKWMYSRKYLSRLSIITCGINVEDFIFDSRSREEMRNQYQLDNNFVIGTVGRFSEQKNIPFIIKLIDDYSKVNKNFKFLWVGDGTLFEKTKNELMKRKLEDYVVFTGNVDYVNKLYSAMDLFVLPSLYEGNPIVALEAQANGLKCILADTLTRESNITGEVSYLKNSRTSSWIKEFDNNINYGHKNVLKSFECSCAIYQNNAIKLEELYHKVMGE